MPAPDRLFTPRFFLMCGFSFTVFLSAFQLLPTAPFRILELGGTTAAAGLFLGFLTYASAASAPLTGAMADRFGKRRILIITSLAIAGFSSVYAVVPGYRILLALVVFHGFFWSGLLSSSAAYTTDFIPPGRRAEGIGYWGLSTVFAVAVAPTIGLWVFEQGGWPALCAEAALLNLVMAGIAWALPPDETRSRDRLELKASTLLEWRVLVVSITLFMYSFGYGGITSFVTLYADDNGVTPRALYFTLFSLSIVCTRPFIGRFADRVGYKRVLFPCLSLVVLGFALLALGGTRPFIVASALTFGIGFGSAYPVFIAYVMRHVDDARRGAAFGGVIGAFDTGIGTGSIAMGWIIEHASFQAAYGTAAVLAALSIPIFVLTERRFLRGPVLGAVTVKKVLRLEGPEA
ncbi:MAG: MFS transporter [Vicinamibacterales bacterium]